MALTKAEIARRYRERHPERVREQQKRGRRTWRNGVLKRLYGITVDDYDRMLKEQGGNCAICGAPPKNRRLHVDHCHTTGKVRALLCTSCNTFLGKIEADPQRLDNVLDYIRRHQT